MQRLCMNAVLNLVTIIMSSVGFTLSVLAHFLATLLPFTLGSRSQIVHTSSLTVVAASLGKDKSTTPAVVSLQLGGAQVNFRASNVTALQRRQREATNKATRVCAPSLPSPAATPLVVEEEYAPADLSSRDREPSVCASEASSDDGSPSGPPSSRKSSFTSRLPQVFRRRYSAPVGPVAGPSTPTRASKPRADSPAGGRSLSPRLRALSLKHEPEEPADAHGRVPYVPNPAGGEVFQTSFVNPFKPKRKSPSPSPASTPYRKSFDLPESPASAASPASAPGPATPTPPTPSPSTPSHRRHRTLASLISSAIRPHARSTTTPRSTSPLPSPPYTSSPYTSSSASSSSSAHSRSRRSFSLSSITSSSETASVDRESIPRTQPYGFPYYAAMPVPLSAARALQRHGSAGRRGASYSGRGGYGDVKPIEESEEGEGQGEGALGLEFGTVRAGECVVTST